MAVSKVIYDNNTLVDLTSDTVSQETLEEGVTAHDAAGVSITGTGLPGRVRYDISQTLTDSEKQQARTNIGAISATDIEVMTADEVTDLWNSTAAIT